MREIARVLRRERRRARRCREMRRDRTGYKSIRSELGGGGPALGTLRDRLHLEGIEGTTDENSERPLNREQVENVDEELLTHLQDSLRRTRSSTRPTDGEVVPTPRNPSVLLPAERLNRLLQDGGNFASLSRAAAKLDNTPESNRDWRERCLRIGITTLPEYVPKNSLSAWKLAYIYGVVLVKTNWRNGTPTHYREVIVDQPNAVSLMCSKDNMLITCGVDGSVYFFNPVIAGPAIIFIPIIKAAILYASVDAHALVTVDSHMIVRIWDSYTGIIVSTSRAIEDSHFASVELKGHMMAFITFDGDLGRWDLLEQKAPRVRATKLGAALVTFNDKIIVTGSRRGTCTVFVEDDRRELENCSDSVVLSLFCNNDYIAAACSDRTVRVWNARTYAVLPQLTIPAFHRVNRIVQLTKIADIRGGHLLLLNSPLVWFYDLASGNLIATLHHRDSVVAVNMNTNFIVTATTTGSVKLWDGLNGKFIRTICGRFDQDKDSPRLLLDECSAINMTNNQLIVAGSRNNKACILIMVFSGLKAKQREPSDILPGDVEEIPPRPDIPPRPV